MPILGEKSFRKAMASANAGLSVSRARLFEPQLDYARTQLTLIVNNVNYHATNITPNAANVANGVRDWTAALQADRNRRNLNMNYNVFRRALSGANLRKLIVNLAIQLDPLASKFVYETRRNAANGTPIKNASTVKSLLNRIIATNPFNNYNPPAGRTPFPGAAPSPAAVCQNIEQATYNFVHNIGTACGRIFQNWNDLNEAFSPYVPWMGNDPATHNQALPIFEYVERITPTGSDYHKGGQQVLLVDFGLTLKRIGPSNRTNKKHRYRGGFLGIKKCRLARYGIANANTVGRCEYGIERVVYKPGDVEMDCKFLGNTAVVNLIAPAGQNGNYNQAASMSEMINNFLGETEIANPRTCLPTYVILPYEAGSLLTQNWPVAPVNNQPVANIRRSYGFLQFLTYKPTPEEEVAIHGGVEIGSLRNALNSYNKPNWQTESDYISTDPDHDIYYFFVWGRVLAMAVTFSLSDLHSQNTIIHRHPMEPAFRACNTTNYPHNPSWPKPHLIDIEDGLKLPMDSVAQTGAPIDNLLKARGSEQRLKTVYAGDPNQITASYQGSPFEYERCQSFTFINNVLTQMRPTADTRAALCEGFISVMEEFHDNIQNTAVDNWLNNLQNVITRFVPRPTGDFYRLLELYLRPYPTAPQRRETMITLARFNGAYGAMPAVRGWSNQVDHYIANGGAPGDNALIWLRAHPYFALEHPDHNFFDYDNLDIPFYVHQLSHAHLLNSRGRLVIPNDVNTYQTTHPFVAPAGVPALDARGGRGGVLPGNLTVYFPSDALAFVRQQVAGLRNAGGPNAHQGYCARIVPMLRELLRIPGRKMEGAALHKHAFPDAPNGGADDNPTNAVVLNGTVRGIQLRPGGMIYDYDATRVVGGGVARPWIVRERGVPAHQRVYP